MTYVGNHVGGDEESKGGASSATTNAYIIISTHPIKGGNLSLFISKVRPERYPMIEDDTPPPLVGISSISYTSIRDHLPLV